MTTASTSFGVIVPITVTDAMIGAGTTIAEPDATVPSPGVAETAWSGSSVAYTVGQVRTRSTTHKKYTCVVGHTSAASPLPENDPTRWQEGDPTNRWCPFDIYSTATKASATGSFTYDLRPGFFTALSLYGLSGATLEVTVKDEPAGATIYSYETDLYAQAMGFYELLFSPLQALTKVVLRDIPISPDAQLLITVDAGSGTAEVGTINIGDYQVLIGEDADFGGTQYGASAEPKTFSYIETAEDGTVSIVRRGSATDLRAKVMMPAEKASAAVAIVQALLDVPVSIIATTADGYDYLNVFGLLSGSATAAGPTHAEFDLFAKGFI